MIQRQTHSRDSQEASLKKQIETKILLSWLSFVSDCERSWLLSCFVECLHFLSRCVFLHAIFARLLCQAFRLFISFFCSPIYSLLGDSSCCDCNRRRQWEYHKERQSVSCITSSFQDMSSCYSIYICRLRKNRKRILDSLSLSIQLVSWAYIPCCLNFRESNFVIIKRQETSENDDPVSGSHKNSILSKLQTEYSIESESGDWKRERERESLIET